MEQESEAIKIVAKMPVGEMFGLSSDLRSATNGRGVQSIIDQSFERLPPNLTTDVIVKIRQRKGLGENE